MRIRSTYRGNETLFDRSVDTIVIGRPKKHVTVDLDLTPDDMVSRPHAQITFRDDEWWIEDLGSRRGTKVDGREIKGIGRQRLRSECTICIGETVLRVENAPAKVIEEGDTTAPAGTQDDADASRQLRGSANTPQLSCANPTVPTFSPANGDPRLGLIYDLLSAFNDNAKLDEFLQHAIERLTKAIPMAQRGAILTKDRSSGRLLLKAHWPADKPSVSSALAQDSLDRGEAFIWRNDRDRTISQKEFGIGAGMCAPLRWRQESIGVICLTSAGERDPFSQDDLELLVAAANYLSLVVANQSVCDDLNLNSTLVERLLTSFSPAIRRRLLSKARQGRLRLGGEKSEVTILSSDIRGFTRIAGSMDADDVVEMLNSYFSVLVEAIFRHDGTIDKFIGDAILAVFGSPEPNQEQHANAVRAAMSMQAKLLEVNEVRRARNQVTCEMGIGIHCGEVLHGFIGSEDRMEFTVIGDAVNRTARFCDGAAGGEVLISPELHQRVWSIVRAEPTEIKTKHEGGFRAFRVLSCKVASDPAK
jgi:adenylate cyclase